jgi:MFS family permease
MRMPADADIPSPVPRRLTRALDLLNFLLADVRDGLGPYLSIYLLLAHRWDQASIGFVMAVGGIGAIVAQAPAGALVDRSTAKRALIIGGALTITACSLAMPMFPGLYSISVLRALTAIAGSVSGNSYWLVGVQLLDGVGAGVFSALFPLVVQDVTHGSGRSTSVWEP